MSDGFEISPELHAEIRGKFANVDACPLSGPRIFFENAGGALTLNSVVETSAKYSAIPDNLGRANKTAATLQRIVDQGKEDVATFFNASGGVVICGESGTELLFRLVSAAALAQADGGIILGSTLEHPASRSACERWAELTNRAHVLVTHDDARGSVSADAFAKHITDDVRVATIVHTSPVSGMSVDVAAISKAIRAKSPNCIIIVDGIQHASHGGIDVTATDVDAYVISPYKVFSRHGYGIAWISDRFAALPHDKLTGAPQSQWDLGTRDVAAYATISDVVSYFKWLGSEFTSEEAPRALIEAAGKAIHSHDKRLTDAMLHGTGNQKGLLEMPGVHIIGGGDNPLREGLVSLWVDHVPSVDLVARLEDAGVRTHIRKNDHYCGNILGPIGREDCIRVSVCHYNSEAEVAQFLSAMHEITSAPIS